MNNKKSLKTPSMKYLYLDDVFIPFKHEEDKNMQDEKSKIVTIDLFDTEDE